MNKEDFFKTLKKDIEALTPYKNNYTMSDISAIKCVYNDLVLNGKSLYQIASAVKRFYNKKRYNHNIIIVEHNGSYNIFM